MKQMKEQERERLIDWEAPMTVFSSGECLGLEEGDLQLGSNLTALGSLRRFEWP
jgi:hypothetical protein